jgi:bifunctional non-homologous end joining protein LigD
MPSGRRPRISLLAKYHAKRRFDETPEPTSSRRVRPRGHRRFVVQRHDASHLHYDFRLEADGVLKSWAVPKGPTLNPADRRLAMQVEDHPLDYFDFEGVIPTGNYGAGEVVVWDWGTYDVVDGDDPTRAIARGRIRIRMHGKKLKGQFTLVKMKAREGKKDNAWLLIKSNDEAADTGWKVDAHDASVKSGTKKLPAARTVRRDAVPVVKHPELATLVDAPFDDDDWLFEVKWDGFRAIATIDESGHVTMSSRNGKDFLGRFPKLTAIGKHFTGKPVVLDGEIVALDKEGRSSFQMLQNAAEGRVSYAVFDVLYAEGHDLRGEPLEARKDVLERILRPSSNVILSTHVVGRGKELFETAKTRGLEGIVAKRRDALYVESRTRDWVKIKAQLEQECVIAGYTEPGGVRTGFGSLVLGLYDHGRLVYCGNVGTGFDSKILTSLSKKMKSLAARDCPFASPPKTRTKAHWIRPLLVAEVRFTEWTHDGSMRHPAFLGLRDDKPARDCHRERPRPTSEVA